MTNYDRRRLSARANLVPQVLAGILIVDNVLAKVRSRPVLLCCKITIWSAHLGREGE
ncbi:hypothetical protein ILP92_13725 [Maribius pontilimi]|uniref:Uncharacterized protein n=1 Tax=Palleronia pontilimi TaxID=1964209 RepID=A0A934IIU0_9RHOB|nr:hypothetical protein [Palleronia pontilimi]MBJ3763812.1 hypothetical protein [Palleronia pontilimi]